MDDTINEVIKQKQSLFKLQPTETTKAKVPKIINFSNRKIEDNCFKRAIERLYGNAEDALFQKGTITQKRILLMKKYLKFLDTIIVTIVIANLCMASYETEMYFNNNNISNHSTDAFRVVIMLFSLILSACVIGDYLLRLHITKLEMKTPFEDNLSLRQRYMLLMEVSVCILCCPPKLDFDITGQMLKGSYTYSVDAIIYLLQLCKSYQFLRVWLEYSMWTSQEATKVCQKYKLKSRFQFALKAELKYRPLKFLGGITLLTILLLGQAVRTFERPFTADPVHSSESTYLSNLNQFQQMQQSLNQYINEDLEDENPESLYNKFENVSDSWWLMIITMTTTGFGDIVPQTHTGRCICIIASILGQLVVSLLVVSLANAAEFSQEESKAYHTIKKIQASSKTKEYACNVIKNFIRFNHLVRQKDAKSYAERFLFHFRLKQEVIRFEKEFQTCQIDNLPLDEMLKKLEVQMIVDIQQIKVEVDKLHEFETRLERYQVAQRKTSVEMKSILTLQTSVQSLLQRKAD